MFCRNEEIERHRKTQEPLARCANDMRRSTECVSLPSERIGGPISGGPENDAGSANASISMRPKSLFRLHNRLRRYPWPGNIRELENVIERAVILSSGPVLRTSTHDLSTRIVSRRDADRPQTLEEVERKHILTTLKETRWTLSGPSGAAARLGLNRSTLYFRMKKLGIARSVNSSFEP